MGCAECHDGTARPADGRRFFCGCGGFSLGAELAGFHTLAAIDIDPTLQSAYRRNFPGTKAIQSERRRPGCVGLEAVYRKGKTGRCDRWTAMSGI